MSSKGKREFIQVLRLMEIFEQDVVADAVVHAIRIGTIGFDAVKQIAVARMERRPPQLDLEAYPHLPQTTVAMTRATAYKALTKGMAA